MSLQERQLRRRLAEDFEPHIDMSDCEDHSTAVQEKMRTSRALAAMTIAAHAKLSVEESCAAVVDESGDNGLDGIGVALARGEVYLVQAKTSAGGPSPTEVAKFTTGIRDLLDWEWSALGPKTQRRRSELEDVLERDVKIIALYSYLSTQQPNAAAMRHSEHLVRDINQAGDILEFRYVDLKDNFEYRNIASGLGSLDHDILFERWVTMSDYRSEIMGIVNGYELARLVESFNDQLFDKNIRSILRDTETNDVLDETLESDPQAFWYYNNGITIVANSISCPRTSPRNGDETFSLKGLNVVNGAQTCGALARALRAGQALEDVNVTVRVISTEGRSADFEKQVTRYTNTQNQVTNREFVALDMYQQELADILLAEDIQYSFRTGHALDEEEYSFAFDLEEATRALACLSSVANATRAKREIGRMWLDIESNPYREIFPRSLSAITMYNAVRFWRTFMDMFIKASKQQEPRGERIVINSAYMVCALLMQWSRNSGCDFSDFNWDVDAWLKNNEKLVNSLAAEMVRRHEDVNPGGFSMSFFKNQEKVERFANDIRASALLDS